MMRFHISQIVLGVDDEVAGLNVVSPQNHFEYFWLVHSSLLHEVDDFVLHSDVVVDVVLKLHLHFVLQRTVFVQELGLVFVGEVFVVFRKQVELVDGRPGEESVSAWVHIEYFDVLASSEQVEFVNFPVESLPVKHMWHPGQRVRQVENTANDLPLPHEWVHEVQVPGDWHEAVVHSVRVFEINLAVSHIVSRVQQQFSVSVELNGF